MLKVFPYNQTDFSGNGIAVFDKASNVKITRELNGVYQLSFDLSVNDDKWQYLRQGSKVVCEGQQYRITRKTRQKQGALTQTVECLHVIADAGYKHIPYFVEMIGASARNIILKAFQGTAFQIMTESEVSALGMNWVDDLTDILPMAKTTPIDILKKLIESLNKGELYVDNYRIALVQRIGRDTGMEYSLSYNLKSLSENEDGNNYINRLYAYGKDGLPLPADAAPKGYIDSTESITIFGIREGYMDFDTVDDPQELLQKALWQFSPDNAMRIDIPDTSYSISQIDLYKLYGDSSKAGIGDSVIVKNSVMGINTTQRIVKEEYYPYSPKQSTAILGKSPKTYMNLFKSLADTQAQYQKTIAPNGDIKVDWLENIRSKLQTEINSIVQRALVHDRADVYVDNLNNPSKAILIGNGIFAIANSKKSNSDWNWRTIASGDKVVADEVDAKWVYSGSVSCDQITAGYISGKITSDAIRIEGKNGYIASMGFLPSGGTEEEYLEIMPTPGSKSSLNFTKNSALALANINCDTVNGYRLSDFSNKNHDHYGVYIENGGGQHLRIQVFNGKMEIWDTGSLIGTITFD